MASKKAVLSHVVKLLAMCGLCAATSNFAARKVTAVFALPNAHSGDAVADPMLFMQMLVAVALGCMVATIVTAKGMQARLSTKYYVTHLAYITVFSALAVVWELVVSSVVLSFTHTQQSIRVVVGISLAMNVGIAIWYVYNSLKND